MSFTSLSFFIFLPVVVLLYFVLPKKIKPIFLLIASYYFYMSANPPLIFIIIGVTLVSYGAGRLLEKYKNNSTRKLILISSIIIILAVLIFFKYFNFLISTVTDFLNLFAMDINFISLDIILPIGISFYTFQTLSYVIDIYQNQYPTEKNIIYYSLYVSFFPQLIAGPIERSDSLIPQLKESHKFSKENFIEGLKILLAGYFMKCCVADTIGLYIDNVFANLNDATSLSMTISSLLFCVQLYCDFNGYSEIARGIAKIMGIDLSKNFNHPFKARTYTEFWSRWHITLSRWFNDYIYLPLSMKSINSKHPLARHIINTFIVFILCGIWHGANLTYVFWGLYAGLIISIESILKDPINKFYLAHPKLKKSPIIFILQKIKFFIILIIPGIMFRSQSVNDMWFALGKLFTGFNVDFFKTTLSNLNFEWFDIIKVILIILGLYFLTNWSELKINNNALTVNNIKTANIILYGVVLLLILICLLNGFYSTSNPNFIYFQF